MNRRSKTREWYKKHINDPFVKEAQEHGYRSRASFKLKEIQDKYKIIQQRQKVCDIGAAPGGWSELAKKWIGPKGTLVACDLLDMNPIAAIKFVQGDFTLPETQATIKEENNNEQFDTIISDLAPNTTGHKATDQLRSVALVEEVLNFCKDNLKHDGCCIVKIFQGLGFDELVKEFRLHFTKIIINKPKSSKAESKEVYIVALRYKGLK